VSSVEEVGAMTAPPCSDVRATSNIEFSVRDVFNTIDARVLGIIHVNLLGVLYRCATYRLPLEVLLVLEVVLADLHADYERGIEETYIEVRRALSEKRAAYRNALVQRISKNELWYILLCFVLSRYADFMAGFPEEWWSRFGVFCISTTFSVIGLYLAFLCAKRFKEKVEGVDRIIDDFQDWMYEEFVKRIVKLETKGECHWDTTYELVLGKEHAGLMRRVKDLEDLVDSIIDSPIPAIDFARRKKLLLKDGLEKDFPAKGSRLSDALFRLSSGDK
jgi:hypothetical protein